MKLLIAKLRRMQFGRSSEKLDRQIEQLELRLEALQQNDAEKVAALPETIASVELRGPTGAAPATGTSAAGSADLSCRSKKTCPDCGGELKQVWEKTFRKMLERIPIALSK